MKHEDARAAFPLLPSNSTLLNSPGWAGGLNESSMLHWSLQLLLPIWLSPPILLMVNASLSQDLPELLAAVLRYNFILLCWETLSNISLKSHSICHQTVNFLMRMSSTSANLTNLVNLFCPFAFTGKLV